MDQLRKLIFYKNYFEEFFDSLPNKVQDKIDYVLFLITIADRIPKKFFEHIAGTDGLFEIRIEFESNIYRIFCCFDEGKLVVLFNGFQKKSQKTPQKEIDRALKIKQEYFNDKKNKAMKKNKTITTFEEHLEERYGKIGSKTRTDFDIKAKAFAIGEIIKDVRKQSKMTQEELAKRTGTQKSFISRIENGHSDIQLSTLYKLIEQGLGKKINLSIS
jgi:phage-related protein/DNA-binding XRE family transcriptional regulator